MPLTVQQLADNAFALSRANRSELIATQAAALVRVADTVQLTLFQFAARVNPLYFSSTADVPCINSAWNRPSNAEALVRIDGAGASTTPNITGEVLVVPYDDRTICAGTPSVYRLGPRFYGAGNAGDPTDGTLRFLYARRPATLSSLGSSTDSELPDAFLRIFEYEIAAFNARSDGGRDEELNQMVAERNRLIVLFENFLEHETLNETRRFGEARRFVGDRRAPLNALTQAAA